MKPYIILIAGIPASGKTTYGRHIAEKLNIPFICKDTIKENLHNAIKWDTSVRANSKLYGLASYNVFYSIIDSLMKAGVSLVAESNFGPASVDMLLPIIECHGYRAITVLMDADLAVLNKRFHDRDITDERHPGLVISCEFEGFNEDEALAFRDFEVGEKIVVDTTDFARVSYAKVDADVINFIGGINDGVH